LRDVAGGVDGAADVQQESPELLLSST